MTEQAMQKKKLLFFHHHSLIGGAGISGGQVLCAIPQDLYDTTVCCNTALGTQMLDYYRELGFRVIDGGGSPQIYPFYSGAETPLFSRRSLKSLRLVLRDRQPVRTILERERPDIVVVNSMALFWIGAIAKSLGMTCVCFFRETYAREWLGIRNGIIRGQLSEHFDAIAFISENDLRQNAAAKCEKTVICDCVNMERYASIDRAAAKEQLKLTAEKKHLLYVGGFSKLKGAHIALETMLRLKETDAVLVFVGADPLLNGQTKPHGLRAKLRYYATLPYRNRCKRMADMLTARGQLVLFPLQKDIAPFYTACDALIAPSTKPHQLRPIYEAGAAKIPVITTRFDAVSEFADDARAYLADNGDVAGFADVARDALFAPDAKRIDANYRSVLQKNSEEAVAARIKQLFTGLYQRLFSETEAKA